MKLANAVQRMQAYITNVNVDEKWYVQYIYMVYFCLAQLAWPTRIFLSWQNNYCINKLPKHIFIKIPAEVCYSNCDIGGIILLPAS